MGEAAKPRLFCCAHVAESMVEAAKPQSLFVIWRRRVYGGSCKAYLVSSFCLSSGVAVSMGKAAKPRLFCCAHVAVSMGEAAKPQSLLLLCRRRVYEGSCKTSVCACPLASPCLWGKLQNFVRFAALLRVYGENCKTSVSACCFIFSRMCSEGFPFIVWGSGGWTLVHLEWLVASSSRR